MRKLLMIFVLLFALRAQAVVLVSNNSVSYACNGSTAAFTVNFPFLTYTDLSVTSTTAGGVVTTLSYGTDFTVNVTSTSTTATVTLTNPAVKCPAGSTLLIARSMSLTQPTSFKAQTTFQPPLHETAYDRLEMQLQQVNAASSCSQVFAGVQPAYADSPILGTGTVSDHLRWDFSVPNTWTGKQTVSASLLNATAIAAQGNGTGAGISTVGGSTNGIGITAQGVGIGAGGNFQGGGAGPGGTFTAGGGNAVGLSGTGAGTGAGVAATGGTGGAGIISTGGPAAISTGTIGGYFTGGDGIGGAGAGGDAISATGGAGSGSGTPGRGGLFSAGGTNPPTAAIADGVNSTGGTFTAGGGASSTGSAITLVVGATPQRAAITFASPPAGFPSVPVSGDTQYIGGKSVLCWYNGSRWICPISGSIALVAGAATVTMPVTGMNCACSEQTTAANGVKCAVSATTLTINGTGTDNIGYVCN